MRKGRNRYADRIFCSDRAESVVYGLAEASLICALDWMDFRKTYPTERATALAPIRAAWADRPSVAATRPHA